jgi:sugar lactone lactonase YvrE
MTMARLVLVLLTAPVLLNLVGCGSGSGSGSSSSQAPTNASGTSQAFAANEHLLVADYFNHRILIYNAPFATAQSASVVLGQANFASAVHATTATGLDFPEKAIADAQGNIWVSDSFNNRVVQYQKPFTNGMAASLVLGQPDFTTSNLAAPTQTNLGNPVGLAFDHNGNLWVADGSRRVLDYTPPFSNGMAASVVLGQSNFTSDMNAATASGLGFPAELAFDANGDLWVADQGNNRVVEYTPPFSSGQSASLVLGQPDFASTAAATTATGFKSPFGVGIDNAGNVWVSDSQNFRVLRFSPPFSNGEAASLVLGQPNFVTAGVNGNGQIDIPNSSGLSFDSGGNLFLAETGSNRVVIFEPPFSILMDASVVIGQPNFNSQLSSTTPSSLMGPTSVSTF